MGAENYVVIATQLNRAYDKELEAHPEPLKRGESFAEGDVTPAELKRWLDLKPRVLVTQSEMDKAQQASADQAAEIAKLQADLAEANAALAAARGEQSPAVTATMAAAGGSVGSEPAKNASKADWQAYALAAAPDDAEFINADTTTRDNLAEKYGSKS